MNQNILLLKRRNFGVDGLNLCIKRPPDENIQSLYYNGWTHDQYITNFFVITPDGRSPMAYFNIPGCVHDSQVAELGNSHAELEKFFDNYGVQCAVDSGFAKIAKDFMVKSTKDDLSSNKSTHKEAKLINAAIGRVGYERIPGIYSKNERVF